LNPPPSGGGGFSYSKRYVMKKKGPRTFIALDDSQASSATRSIASVADAQAMIDTAMTIELRIADPAEISPEDLNDYLEMYLQAEGDTNVLPVKDLATDDDKREVLQTMAEQLKAQAESKL